MFMILTCNIDEHLFLWSESSKMLFCVALLYTKCVVYKFWLLVSRIKINA